MLTNQPHSHLDLANRNRDLMRAKARSAGSSTKDCLAYSTDHVFGGKARVEPVPWLIAMMYKRHNVTKTPQRG
jgi:hypothetical protein